MKRIAAFLAAAIAFGALVAGPITSAGASDADGTYELPVWFRWERSTLDVIVVPPNHGQLLNGNGALNGGDPNELTPFNSYLKAVEASIADWDTAVAMFGAQWLRDGLVTNVYVAGRDQIPPDALSNPEIIVASDETKGNILGLAFSTRPCLVDNSKFFIQSFTYEDMYSINAQEYGHCLGLEHVVENHPELDAMAGLYVHTPGAKGNPLNCPSNLDVIGLEAVFGRLFGKPSPNTVSIPVAAYGSICRPPSGVIPGASTSPQPGSTTVPGPQPSASSSPSPSPSASSTPTPQPSSTPSHRHPRTIGLTLARHVSARGEVSTSDGSDECYSHVRVELERKTRSGWQVIATSVTMADGSFRRSLPDRVGRYRARVAESSSGSHICDGATSQVRMHRHP